MKVLIVDGSEVERYIMRSHLRGKVSELWEARKGREALTLLREVRPGLVLLALDLPDMDGIEVLERLRRYSGARDLAVLLLAKRALSTQDRMRLPQGPIHLLPRKALEAPERADALFSHMIRYAAQRADLTAR